MESSSKAHLYLWMGAFLLFIIFCVYVFVAERRENIQLSPSWTKIFKEVGISDDDMKHIEHDDTHWYYKGSSTCVGFGQEGEVCPRSEAVCSDQKYGNMYEQALLVAEAIFEGGISPKCPI